MIRFNLNGVFYEEDDLPPLTSVYSTFVSIRVKPVRGLRRGGDCGACTIVLAREDESGNAIYEAVNSCLLMLPQLDGANVVTVEEGGGCRYTRSGAGGYGGNRRYPMRSVHRVLSWRSMRYAKEAKNRRMR